MLFWTREEYSKFSEAMMDKPISFYAFEVLYESLAAAAKKYITQEKKESKLQKALDAAYKLIAELKAQVAALTKKLFKYKSIHNRLNTAGLQQENEILRGKVHSYETVIERNNLWRFFDRHRAKTHTRDDAR